jgi:hypothetical protein
MNPLPQTFVLLLTFSELVRFWLVARKGVCLALVVKGENFLEACDVGGAQSDDHASEAGVAIRLSRANITSFTILSPVNVYQLWLQCWSVIIFACVGAFCVVLVSVMVNWLSL